MTVIVDSKLLYYEEHHKQKPGVNLFDTLANYLMYIEKTIGNKITNIIMVYDIGKSTYRLNLWPKYKAKRTYTHLPESFKSIYEEQIPKIAKALGIVNYPIDGVEADDLAGILSHKIQDDIILISGDQDWCQLVLELGDRVRYFYVKKYTILGVEETKELTRCSTVEQFLIKKSATDDTGDNIRGIVSIGKITFQKWADTNFNRPDEELKEAFLSLCNGRGAHQDYKEHSITTCEQLYEFNMKLGRIMTDLSLLSLKQQSDLKSHWVLGKTKTFNPEEAIRLSSEYAEGHTNPFGGGYEMSPVSIEYYKEVYNRKT